MMLQKNAHDSILQAELRKTAPIFLQRFNLHLPTRYCFGVAALSGKSSAGVGDHSARATSRFQMKRTTTAPTMAPMKPAPWSGRYQPINWPTQVARNAPTTPSTVVRMKPEWTVRAPRNQSRG